MKTHDIRFIDVKCAAAAMADEALVAYYQLEDFDADGHRAANIDRHFRKLAEDLGYRVEKAPVEMLEAAE